MATRARKAGIVAAGLLVTAAVYAAMIWATNGFRFPDAVLGGASTAAAALIAAAPVWFLLRRLSAIAPTPNRVAAAHVLFALMFAALWAGVIAALIAGDNPRRLEWYVRTALGGQLIIGVAVYAVLAALERLERANRELREREAEVFGAAESPTELTRILVRRGAAIVPIAVSDIERLEAADDYVAVIAGGQRSLVDLTLAEFQRRLDPARFVRVHRSHIVNLEHVGKAHPSGDGRLEIRMRDGTMITASRAGSRTLRQLTV